MMERIIIVAASRNGAIGRGNALLWHISADLKYFKATTMGYPIIMGRRTFESVGRALPGRLNIVVSSKDGFPEGVVVARSLPEAYEIAEASGASKCFITGGGKLYEAALKEGVDRLYITKVEADFPDADTFFPPLDPSEWTLESSSDVQTNEKSGLAFRFEVYMRNPDQKRN